MFFKKYNGKTIILVRYTFDVWKRLFPYLSIDTWENQNMPNDLGQFMRKNMKNAIIIKTKNNEKRMLIATIDDVYISWLQERNITHSIINLKNYIMQRLTDDEFWNERLIHSGMIDTYNVISIATSLILPNLKNNSSEYSLTHQTSSEITSVLKNIFHKQEIFVPGWIIKGKDVIVCRRDLIQLANFFWNKNKLARCGRFIEQNYDTMETKNKFKPLYFTIPFVIKEKMNSAINCDNIEKEAALVNLSEQQTSELFKLINNDIPQIISINKTFDTPLQSYMNYQSYLLDSDSAAANVFKY